MLRAQDGDFAVHESQLAFWRQMFPELDISREMRGLCAWLACNPNRRPPLSDMTAWLNNCLAFARNRQRMPKSGGRLNFAAIRQTIARNRSVREAKNAQ